MECKPRIVIVFQGAIQRGTKVHSPTDRPDVRRENRRRSEVHLESGTQHSRLVFYTLEKRPAVYERAINFRSVREPFSKWTSLRSARSRTARLPLYYHAKIHTGNCVPSPPRANICARLRESWLPLGLLWTLNGTARPLSMSKIFRRLRGFPDSLTPTRSGTPLDVGLHLLARIICRIEDNTLFSSRTVNCPPPRRSSDRDYRHTPTSLPWQQLRQFTRGRKIRSKQLTQKTLHLKNVRLRTTREWRICRKIVLLLTARCSLSELRVAFVVFSYVCDNEHIPDARANRFTIVNLRKAGFIRGRRKTIQLFYIINSNNFIICTVWKKIIIIARTRVHLAVTKRANFFHSICVDGSLFGEAPKLKINFRYLSKWWINLWFS